MGFTGFYRVGTGFSWIPTDCTEFCFLYRVAVTAGGPNDCGSRMPGMLGILLRDVHAPTVPVEGAFFLSSLCGVSFLFLSFEKKVICFFQPKKKRKRNKRRPMAGPVGNGNSRNVRLSITEKPVNRYLRSSSGAPLLTRLSRSLMATLLPSVAFFSVGDEKINTATHLR